MDQRILKWLYDIKLSINEIEDYFDQNPKNFIAFKSNTMLKRAIERNLEIIGEATNRILKRDPDFENEITSARSIIGLRNQVIHAYDNVSDETIWSIITNHLPKLKIEINDLINKSKD